MFFFHASPARMSGLGFGQQELPNHRYAAIDGFFMTVCLAPTSFCLTGLPRPHTNARRQARARGAPPEAKNGRTETMRCRRMAARLSNPRIPSKLKTQQREFLNL